MLKNSDFDSFLDTQYAASSPIHKQNTFDHFRSVGNWNGLEAVSYRFQITDILNSEPY